MALTDGKYKYIHFRSTGEEQFFDLTKDPGEEMELSKNPEYKDKVALWREHLIQHLSERGPKFVKRGKLVKNKRGILLSPNYPSKK